MPSPEPQSPFSCTWNPCSESGLRPRTFASTRTRLPRCVKVTVPAALLPLVGCSSATATVPLPTSGIPPQAAMTAAAAASTSIIFMGCPFSTLFLRCGLVRCGLRVHGSGLGGTCGRRRGRRAGGGRRRCGRNDRRGLRDGLAGLLHVRLVVLHRLFLGLDLRGLGLGGRFRVLGLLLLGRGLALLVQRRGRREFGPRRGCGES